MLQSHLKIQFLASTSYSSNNFDILTLSNKIMNVKTLDMLTILWNL